MLIDERILPGGDVVRTRLDLVDATLVLRDDVGLDVTIPAAWVVKVMQRYGRELDPDIQPDPPEIDLGGGHALGRLDFRAQVDADSRTYLILHGPGHPPLAALSNGATAALRHLATRS